MRILLLALIGLLIVVLAGCSSTDAEQAEKSALEQRAETWCRDSRPADAALPPKPFTTDGCSMWPDSDWGHCCVEHDIEYWCGGSRTDRSAADRRLRQCLADNGNPAMGVIMQIGTRTGGFAVLPLPWRWGYGWPWPEDGDLSE